jgi:hypothetical protein
LLQMFLILILSFVSNMNWNVTRAEMVHRGTEDFGSVHGVQISIFGSVHF